jgi:glycerophosphoryl diester phosphodiesterase
MVGSRIRVVGHRGATALAPENTIASLGRGVRDGADEVEFDVQRTKDEVAVLLHDDTLDRTTSGRGPLRERTLSEVRLLDAGSWFGAEFSGERIPSLAEVCAWAKSAGADLSVELKQPAPAEGLPMDDGLAESVVEELRATGLLARAVIHSFDHPTVARVREIAPDARAALLYTGPNLVDPLAIARTVPGIVAIHLRWYWVSRQLCEAAHAEGLRVHAYGIPEPLERETVLRLTGFGVDSLSADDPGQLVKLLAAEGLR